MRRLIRKLASNDEQLHFCYEAGPAGTAASERPDRVRVVGPAQVEQDEGVAAQRVDQHGRAGDIAAHHAKGLAQRALDHGRTRVSPSRSAMPPPRGSCTPTAWTLSR
jgi:hypothetical protein